MFVKSWMSAPAVAIPPVVPAHAALGFMELRNIRRLPVVDDHRLVGIVTKSDLNAALGKSRPTSRRSEVQVDDVMTSRPVTVTPNDTLEHAAQLMINRKVSGLPVIDKRKLVGIITESDVFRALCEMMGIGERGARIAMTVRDDQNLLNSIKRRLNGLTMRSLVTVHNSKRSCWDVVIRVRGRTKSHIKSATGIAG